MKFIITGVILILAAILGAYYYFVYPPAVLKHRTEQAIQEFNTAVATKEHVKILGALNHLLAEQAHVKLHIRFLSVLDKNSPTITQDFNKDQFLGFMDNVLYPLQDYYFVAKLRKFSLNEDKKTAAVVFNSSSWADDTSYLGKAHFTADIECTAEVVFYPAVNVNDAECTVQMTALPRS